MTTIVEAGTHADLWKEHPETRKLRDQLEAEAADALAQLERFVGASDDAELSAVAERARVLHAALTAMGEVVDRDWQVGARPARATMERDVRMLRAAVRMKAAASGNYLLASTSAKYAELRRVLALLGGKDEEGQQ
jgi:hypothetical protein